MKIVFEHKPDKTISRFNRTERLELKNNALGEKASQLVYKGNAYRLFS